MTMQAAAYGRIGQDSKSITTRTGKAIATASIAVAIGDADEPPLWLGVVAFGHAAEDLLRQKKSDLISVSGRVQRNAWTTPAGEKREQLQIVADTLMSARTVRPAGGRRRSDDTRDKEQPPTRASGEPGLSDEIPF